MASQIAGAVPAPPSSEGVVGHGLVAVLRAQAVDAGAKLKP